LVTIPIEDTGASLKGDLRIPSFCNVKGIIIFAHGSGSGKDSPRNQYVGRFLNEANFGTLLIDLLTPDEQNADFLAIKLSGNIQGLVLNKFNIKLLTKRLVKVTEWIRTYEQTRNFKIGYFGASTGAAAAIEAAVLIHGYKADKCIYAIVSRGGRPDLASPFVVRRTNVPTLFIVGSKDSKSVLDLNKKALKLIKNSTKKLVMVSGAGHLFEEPGTMEEVTKFTSQWFLNFLK
jgi:putative phosphoribosyl transferase